QLAISAAVLEPDQLVQRVLDPVVELSGAEGAVVALLDGGDIVWQYATGAASPHAGRRYRAEGSLAGRCAARGQVVVSDDVSGDARASAETAAQVEARA